jgi:hypothetical protein
MEGKGKKDKCSRIMETDPGGSRYEMEDKCNNNNNRESNIVQS